MTPQNRNFGLFAFLTICLLMTAQLVRSQSSATPHQTDQKWMALKEKILTTKLTTPQHERLIFQAKDHGFEQDAYLIYHPLTQRRQVDGMAMLWRGMSSLVYWRSKHLRHSDEVQAQLNEAREAFEIAERLIPNEPILLREYGFFLWQFDNQMDKGLKMMRRAETLRPTDPYVHAALGNVYSNHSGNAFNLSKSEREYREAVRIAPNLPSAYWGLSLLYYNLGRYQEAQAQMQTYVRLTPKNNGQDKDQQSIIANVLSQKH